MQTDTQTLTFDRSIVKEGYLETQSVGGSIQLTKETKTVTPTENSQQISPTGAYYRLDSVTVEAIPSTYVGSGITQRTSSDLTASGATVTVPSGYYSVNASKSVNSGSLNYNGWTETETETRLTMTMNKSFTAGYLSSAPDISRTFTNVIDTTITPSTSRQTVNRPNGNTFIKQVIVEAMPSGTAGTPTATKGTVSDHSISIIPSVTNTTGYITGGTKTGTAINVSASELVSGTLNITSSGTKDVTNYASASVAAGSATASATKGTVTNHSISVTPMVTRTAGYVTSGTADGTAVTVSASELVSDTLSITENGTADVTNYASVDVNVNEGPTYTATIVGNGSISYPACYVSLNNSSGTKYYTDGTTFTFSYDDDLYFTANGKRAGGQIILNGVTVAGSAGNTDAASYTYKTPRCNLTIQFKYGVEAVIEITVPEISITANGQYDVSEYERANVEVVFTGMSETDLRSYIQRGSAFTDIDWPDELTIIGPYAFANCIYFAPSSLPSGINRINEYAFYYCNRLALTSLPSGVTGIGQYAFRGCTNLALTSLPGGLTSLGNYAFQLCSSLALTNLPSGITSVGTGVFASCNSLSTMDLSGITSIGPNSFQNDTSLATVTLSSGLRNIDVYAFNGCSLLVVSTLPDSLTSIGNGAFGNCESITSISCEGTITTLGSSAFLGNTSYPMSLTSVSFPNMALTSTINTVFGSTTAANACQLLEFCDIGSTTGIAANAFANCYALQTLVLRKTASVCTLVNVSAFLNTPMRGYNSLTGKVYVPSALISSYKTASNWKTLYNAGTVEFLAIEGSEYER